MTPMNRRPHAVSMVPSPMLARGSKFLLVSRGWQILAKGDGERGARGEAVVIHPGAMHEFHPQYPAMVKKQYQNTAGRVQANVSRLANQLSSVRMHV